MGNAMTDLGPARVAEVDASDMLGAIAGLARQVGDGYEGARRRLAAAAVGDGAGGATPAMPARPAAVAVLGMGGSAIGADLVFAACEPPVPTAVVRGYALPAWVDPGTLVVAVSYSGDTEETLAATEAALARGCTPLCVTSGGRLMALAAGRGLPTVAVSPGLQPRAALGHLAMPVLAALERVGLVAPAADQVAEAAAVLAEAAASLAPAVGDDANLAKAVARRLAGKVAVVCGAGVTVPVARRWKTQLNENAKVDAFSAELPELDHNEVEGWGGGGPLSSLGHVVLLADGYGDERLTRRVDLSAAAIAACDVSVERLETRGVSALARILSLVTLGDHVSLYLALLRGVDPTPVGVISRMKRERASRPDEA